MTTEVVFSDLLSRVERRKLSGSSLPHQSMQWLMILEAKYASCCNHQNWFRNYRESIPCHSTNIDVLRLYAFSQDLGLEEKLPDALSDLMLHLSVFISKHSGKVARVLLSF